METLDGFKPIGANGCLREKLQWKCRVFLKQMLWLNVSLKRKGITIATCDYVTVEGENVGFLSVMMKSYIN